MCSKPDLQSFASTENVREFIDIWCDWGWDRLFPNRTEVVLRDIAKFLKCTVLYDIEAPDKIMVRYFGGQMMDYVGGDHTGQNYLSFANKEQRPLRWGRHASFVDKPCGGAWTIIDRHVGSDVKLNAIGISLPLGAAKEYDQASQVCRCCFRLRGILGLSMKPGK